MTLLFAVGVLAAVAYLFTHTSAELAPEEDQGILFAVTKAPRYANLDYYNAYGDQLDKAFSSFPETQTRFIINGTDGVNDGFAGLQVVALGRARAQHQGAAAAGAGRRQRHHRPADLRLLAAALARHHRRPAGRRW